MMDGHYEWQKFRANERIQMRLQEAEAHRRAKEGENGRASFTFPGLTRIKAVRFGLERLFRLRKRRVYREKSA
jgi:hypothetical protein